MKGGHSIPQPDRNERQSSLSEFTRFCCGDPNCKNDCEREKPEIRGCASGSRHTGHLWWFDGAAMWCNGRG